MSRVKLAVTASLMAVLLSACGIPAKPAAGTPNLNHQKGYHGKVKDPRQPHLACLRASGLPFHEYYTAGRHLAAIQVGTLPTGPTIIFEPTVGGATYLKVSGQAQGAELIGDALLYPNRSSDHVLSIVEGCTVIGVKDSNTV